MSIFLNFDYVLRFQGYLLQELAGQTQCNHFGENFMKIDWLVLEIFSVFSVFFLRDIFSTCKWRLSCMATSIHVHTFLYKSSTMIIFCKQFLNRLNSFKRKLTICAFHSTLNRWKRKQHFGKTDKVVLSFTQGNENSLEYCNYL